MHLTEVMVRQETTRAGLATCDREMRLRTVADTTALAALGWQ